MPRPPVRRSRAKGLPDIATNSSQKSITKSPCPKRRSARLAAKAGAIENNKTDTGELSTDSSFYNAELPVPRRESLFGDSIGDFIGSGESGANSSTRSKSFRDIGLNSGYAIISSENEKRSSSSSGSSPIWVNITKDKSPSIEGEDEGKSNQRSHRTNQRSRAARNQKNQQPDPRSALDFLAFESPIPISNSLSSKDFGSKEDSDINSSPIVSHLTEQSYQIERADSSDSDTIYLENAENVPPGEPLSSDPFGFNDVLNIHPKLTRKTTRRITKTVGKRPVTHEPSDFNIYHDSIDSMSSPSSPHKPQSSPSPKDVINEPPQILKPLTSESLVSRLPQVLKRSKHIQKLGKVSKKSKSDSEEEVDEEEEVEDKKKKRAAKPQKSLKRTKKIPSKTTKKTFTPQLPEFDSKRRQRIKEINEKFKKVDEWELNEVLLSSSPSSSSLLG